LGWFLILMRVSVSRSLPSLRETPSGRGRRRDEGVGGHAGARLRLRPRAHRGRHALALRHPAARKDRRRRRVQEHPRHQ